MTTRAYKSLFVLVVLLSLPVALADNQIIIDQSLSTSGTAAYIFSVLPNVTLVTNTTMQLWSSNSLTTSHGSVTFIYNDSTSTTPPEFNTTSLTPLSFTYTNPNPGKLVDSIQYIVARSPNVNVAFANVVDVWERNASGVLTIQVINAVNGSFVAGFCALLTTTVNATCSMVNGSAFYDGNTNGWQSQTAFNSEEHYLNAWKRQPNVSRSSTIGTSVLATPPWYSVSNSCTTSNLNTGCGLNSSQKNNTNYYCLVTDELSQYCEDFSFTTNSTNEPYLSQCLNTIKSLNASTGGYGTLTEWASRYDNRTGTPSIDKGYTNDNAADADARFIIGLWNTANNPNITNATLKAAASTYATSMCSDFVAYNFLKTNKISNSNTSRNITYFPCGGANVCPSLTNNDQMYSGYYGDMILALLACRVGTGNTTYTDAVANDAFESMLAAANWTPTTGFRVTPGRAFKWTSAAQPTAVCTTVCTPSPYIDDPDGKRMVKVCGAVAVYAQAGLTLHPQAAEYCREWYYQFNSTTQYILEWYANGTRFSSLTDQYDANSLAVFLDLQVNLSNALTRANLVGQNKFQTSTESFDSASCQGIYNPAFAPESYGYLISPTVPITFGFNTGSSCTGQGPTVSYTQGGLRLDVNGPGNNTNITQQSVLLNITPYNLNASGNTTAGTLPHLIYNSTLCTVDPGWNGGTYSAGTCSENWTSGNVFSQNLSMESSYPAGTWQELLNITYPGGTNNKFHPTSLGTGVSGNNRFNLEAQNATHFHIKADRGGFSSTGNYPYNRSLIVNFTTNFTTNVSRACVGTDCTAWEAFTREAGAEDYLAFEPGTQSGTTQIFNYTITEMVTPYNVSSGSGNSSMNVTIRNALTGAILAQFNSTQNGTTLTYNWTGLAAGAWNWQVNVWSAQNNETFGNLTFTVVLSGKSYNLCNYTGTTITHTAPANYTILIYNVTGGGGAPSYFNQTLTGYNFNTTNGYYSYLNFTTYQAALTLGAYRLFLNTSITTFNATNGYAHNTTSTTTLFLPANNGTNQVRIDTPGNYSLNVTCTVTAPLTTPSCNATGIYDALYAFNATDALLGNSINNFTLTIQNTTVQNPYVYNQTTQNGSLILPLLQGYWYSTQFTTPNSTHENLTVPLQPTSALQYYTFTVFPSFSIVVTIRDATTNTLITQNITLEITSNTTGLVTSTTTGTYTSASLIAGEYVIRLYNANYSASTYTFTPSSNGVYFLTAYLQQNTNDLEMQFVDSIASTLTLPGVLVTQQRFINGSWQAVNIKETDITGRTTFGYNNNTAYRFIATAIGYQTKIFDLNPVLFTSYTVKMQRVTTTTTYEDFQSVYVDYDPKVFYDGTPNEINLTFNSPTGLFTTYNYTVSYPGGILTGQGNNVVGQTYTVDFNITGASLLDTVNITLSYDTTFNSTRPFTYRNLIIISPGTNTLQGICSPNSTYGLGLLERLIIGTLIIVIFAGLLTIGAGPTFGLTMGLLLMGLWVYTCFWPWWAAGISFLVGFAIIAARTD